MHLRNTPKSVRMLLALVLLVGALALAACSSSSQTSSSSSTSSTTAPTGTTAKDLLPKAMSELSTAAPDGKLLVCQSFQPITTTSTPGWEYLVGSPKSGKVYAVLIMGGKTQFMEYGTAGLSPDQWTQIPSVDEWKIDSDVAHEKALTVYPQGKNAAYYPGFVTYVPKNQQNSNNVPMTWYVRFDPSSRGNAATDTVLVDMRTGAARLATSK